MKEEGARIYEDERFLVLFQTVKSIKFIFNGNKSAFVFGDLLLSLFNFYVQFLKDWGHFLLEKYGALSMNAEVLIIPFLILCHHLSKDTDHGIFNFLH